ncbi:K(+)-transporting ATPase subunit F [Staphylococcus aureus]|nr:K(+)-transporting ATPase subunit F [Staphylococcus aureus]MBH4697094.1 K(+)-transporting ATPase subunit F [Staphylococcus aureus]MBH4701886.1 K(+)-transporting ATPase subunit F [Staphylococcus aureus]MBH4704835.1 K(+)-transporting ATPase subunit F [Staphylococcus aureus]MBH4707237.1 K(+)-transporting ATPase subunit F [Staphylococcus aureus]
MLLCCKEVMAKLIVLLLVVIALVLYLFYALIRSEKF